MRTKLITVTLAGAVILAGCDGSDPEPTPTSDPTTVTSSPPAAVASSAPPAMATPTPTPTPTGLRSSTAGDAVDAMLAAWNVVLSMPDDAAEPTPEALQAIDDLTVDGSDAATFLQTRAELLTAVEARGDVIGVPLEDFEATSDSFTVTACLSIEATSVVDDSVVGNGTWSAFDVAGTVVDGRVQLDHIANVAVPDPDATPVPIDDQDPSEPAPDACVPPTQQAEILDRADGFIDAFTQYRRDTTDEDALARFLKFTNFDGLIVEGADSDEFDGLMTDVRIVTATRDSATTFWCQDPDLNASATVTDAEGNEVPAPELVWELMWNRESNSWMVTNGSTYGQPELSLSIPYGWERCFGSE